MTFQQAWRALERILRVDQLESGWAILQARAIYTVVLGFGILQLLNTVVSSYVYGGWTPYLLPSIAFTIVGIPLALTLRWTKGRTFQTVVIAGLVLTGIAVPAMAENTGIDTSLVPYLAVSPVVIAFIGGWRAGLLFYPAAVALLFALAENAVPGVPGLLQGLSVDQQLRLTQAISGVSVATLSSCGMSAAAEAALTRLESARADAKSAEASKSQFLASMSHELRTPMNAVIGLTGVILNDEHSELSARHRKLLETVDGAGRQLLGIVDDILNISKLDANMVVIEIEPFDLKGLMRHLMDTFSANAEAKGIELTLDISEEVPPLVNGDDLRVRQVFSNLLSNAIKFTEDGSVHVRSGILPGRPNWVWIEVEDSGCGVPKERSEAIFDPFEQADRGSARRHDGTGLGLAICRRMAELMGGEINLKRTGPDGTTFVVILPLPKAEALAEPATPLAAQPPERLDGLQVLVVEDNAVNRLVIGEILSMLGAQTRFAENGREALDAFGVYEIDLVLMDKHMPEMDGIEATRIIRESGESWARVPIIAATADAMEGEEAAMLAAGMDGFISKPVRAQQLAAVIHKVLRREAVHQLGKQSVGTT